MDVYVANAFSKDNKGGNKAGVVLQQACLNEAEKTKTAFLLGYSETAFVFDSELADFKLEYFTSFNFIIFSSLCQVYRWFIAIIIHLQYHLHFDYLHLIHLLLNLYILVLIYNIFLLFLLSH